MQKGMKPQKKKRNKELRGCTPTQTVDITSTYLFTKMIVILVYRGVPSVTFAKEGPVPSTDSQEPKTQHVISSRMRITWISMLIYEPAEIDSDLKNCLRFHRWKAPKGSLFGTNYPNVATLNTTSSSSAPEVDVRGIDTVANPSKFFTIL